MSETYIHYAFANANLEPTTTIYKIDTCSRVFFRGGSGGVQGGSGGFRGV